MEDLFTIIITHYNQEQYIFEAINSVLNQNYSNIELLIADDCSKEFSKEKIFDYIEKSKGENIKNVEFIINSENLGTVKTLNKAIKKAKGKYISFFAADDMLNNGYVIENYVKAFKKYNKKIITGQCFEYDKFLKENKGPYVDVKRALKNNKKSAQNLYIEMFKYCLYASGATAYDASVFKEYGYFDEKYKLVEDWTYWLFILRKGVMIHFINYPILNHREGGVSHYTENDLPPHVKVYFKDLLSATTDVVNDMPKDISDMKKLSIYKRAKELFDYYLENIKETNKKTYYDELIKKSMDKEFKNPKTVKFKAKIYNFLKWQVYYKFKSIPKCNKLLFSSIVLWIIINCVAYNNQLMPTDNNLIYLIVSFLVSSIISDVLIRMGDCAIVCAPATAIVTSLLLKIFTISNTFLLIAMMILIYIIIYYLYFLIRVIKIKLGG